MNNYILDELDSIEELNTNDYKWVYDLEIDSDEHTFLANDILVHNSLFFTYTPAIESCNLIEGFSKDENVNEKIKEFILKLTQEKIVSLNEQFLNEFSANFGLPNNHDFELEKIADVGIFLAKKRYVIQNIWKDGKHIKNKEDTDRIFIKGLEMVRSSTPYFVRTKFNEIIEYLFDKKTDFKYDELLKITKKLKKEFENSNIESISFQSSIGDYDKFLIDDKNKAKFIKGTPGHIRAAIYHNFLLNQHPKYKDKYELLKVGDKIKYYYTKHPKFKVFAFARDKYPVEFAMDIVPIDYETQFDKCLLNLINRFNKVLKIPEFNSRLTSTKGLFNYVKK